MSLVATGITAACGVWFVAELVAYLIAVDKTLPQKARKVRKSTVRKMQNARQLEEYQSMMENEASAISPMMPEKPAEEPDDSENEENEIGPQLR